MDASWHTQNSPWTEADGTRKETSDNDVRRRWDGSVWVPSRTDVWRRQDQERGHCRCTSTACSSRTSFANLWTSQQYECLNGSTLSRGVLTFYLISIESLSFDVWERSYPCRQNRRKTMILHPLGESRIRNDRLFIGSRRLVSGPYVKVNENIPLSLSLHILVTTLSKTFTMIDKRDDHVNSCLIS